MFSQNEGTIDRLIRAVGGAGLILLGLLATGGLLAVVLTVVGAVMLVTGATGWCAIYALLGIDTRRGRPHGPRPIRR